MTGFKRRIWNDMTATPILPVLVVAFALSILFVPRFATIYNLKNYLLQTADLLIICCGVTFVVLNGGIDFSATSVLTLGSVVGAYIMAVSPLASNPAASIPIAMIAMAATGAIVGLINGVAVTRLKIPSFIATLATQLVFTGIAVLFTSKISDTASISGLPESFFAFGGSRPFFLLPIGIAFLFWFVSHWTLSRTLFGRYVYAIGINPRVSFVSGVPVKRIILILMVMSGLFAGVASILATARNQVGLASLGDKMFITLIASVIVGGTSTAGGVGGMKETLMGVLFITLINNTMNLLGVGWYVIMIVLGTLVIVSAVSSYMIRSRVTSGAGVGVAT